MEDKNLKDEKNSVTEEKKIDESILPLPKEEKSISSDSNSDIVLPSKKEESKPNESNDIDLPKVTSNQSESQEKNDSTNESNIVLPEAANSDTDKVETANSTLNPEVNFSQIFNVASEEETAPETTENKNEDKVPSEEKAPITTSNDKESQITNNDEVKKDENSENSVENQNKKNNSDAFNSEEKVLYEIQPEKEGNPIVVLAFFALLIVFVIILPIISKNSSIFQFNPPVNNDGSTVEKEEDEKYSLHSSSIRIKIGDLEFANFVDSKTVDTYSITFTMTNNAQTPYMFDKKYYIVFYDDNDSVVYRALIHSYEAIGALGAQEVNLVLTKKAFEKATKFNIEEISTSRYPAVDLIETEGEYKVLTCNYQNDEMKYYFMDNKLSRIQETYRETRDSSLNYEKNLTIYQGISERNKSVEGFNSTFVEDGNYFTMLNEFNLKDITDINLSNLHEYRYFKYNESKDIVAFEVEAQGYQCR